jgi:hypothetical protein
MISTRTPLVLRYFIWGMLIFAISTSLWGFRVLRSLELTTLSLPLPGRHLQSYRYLEEVEIPFVTIPVYGAWSDQAYFNIARDIVRRLSQIGARAVIIPLPSAFGATPQAVNTLRAIARDSIAIFGVQNPITTGFRPQITRGFHRQSHWWVEHPFYNQIKVQWGVLSAYADLGSPVVRFIPAGWRETKTGTPVTDVTLLALRKYLNLTDEVTQQAYASRIPLGPYPIALAKDRISYLRYAYRAKETSILVGTADPLSDSIRYFADWSRGNSRLESLEQLWSQHKDKIVFIDWTEIRGGQLRSSGWLYTQVFASVFKRSFVSVHQEWNVLLITTLTILLSVFSYTMRNGLTIALSFALFVASIFISSWLFDSYNVLFDPLYVLVPILLCGIVLPIVKTSGEKKLAEAAIKSLEEENRRLLELQRRSTHDPRV